MSLKLDDNTSSAPFFLSSLENWIMVRWQLREEIILRHCSNLRKLIPGNCSCSLHDVEILVFFRVERKKSTLSPNCQYGPQPNCIQNHQKNIAGDTCRRPPPLDALRHWDYVLIVNYIPKTNSWLFLLGISHCMSLLHASSFLFVFYISKNVRISFYLWNVFMYRLFC